MVLSARFEEACCALRAEGPLAASRLFGDLLDLAESAENVDPRLVVDVQWNLGESLLDAGETDAAVGVLEVAVANARLFYGTASDHTLRIRLTYIRSLGGDGRLDEARQQAEQLTQDAERIFGPDHPTTADAQSLVAELG